VRRLVDGEVAVRVGAFRLEGVLGDRRGGSEECEERSHRVGTQSTWKHRMLLTPDDQSGCQKGRLVDLKVEPALSISPSLKPKKHYECPKS